MSLIFCSHHSAFISFYLFLSTFSYNSLFSSSLLAFVVFLSFYMMLLYSFQDIVCLSLSHLFSYSFLAFACSWRRHTDWKIKAVNILLWLMTSRIAEFWSAKWLSYPIKMAAKIIYPISYQVINLVPWPTRTCLWNFCIVLCRTIGSFESTVTRKKLPNVYKIA